MNIIKRITIILAVIMGVTAVAQAQNIKFTLLSSNQNEAKVRVDFGSYQTKTVSVNGTEMQKLIMADAYPILEAGSPELLKTTFSLIIPEGSSPEVDILDAQYTVVEHFALAPSKGVIYRNVDPESVPYTKNQDYQSDKYLLGNSIMPGEQYQLRDYHGMNFKVYPFDYNPKAQSLKIYSSVTVKVTFNATKAVSAPVKNNRTFDAVYANQFLNYQGLRGSLVSEEGDILIIAPEIFMDAMQPYAEWKTRYGYHTELVSLTTTGNNADLIKSYIQNYYNEHNLAFVVIVGDNAQFPTPTINGDKSDNYFTELVGNDSYPDIILGKISAENVEQVETQVQRFIDYERNPSETSHLTSFLGIASEQGYGDNGEIDYQHIRNINNKLLNYTYTSGYEMFEGSQGGLDGHGNPTASMVGNAVNNGVGIINYCGHGSEQVWGTSYFSNSDIDNLTNDGKLPFIISVACLNGAYHSGTCFAEAWLRATHDGEYSGAVGFTGSTINQPWNEPMRAQDAMIDFLIGTVSADQKFTFGGMFFNGMIKMLDAYHNSASVFRTWILFGDPTLQLRTAVPEQLDLSYTEHIPVDYSSVEFLSTVENAKVSVSHGNEIVAVGRIEGGVYTLEINEPFLLTDTLRILATAPNYLPFEGTLTFIPNEGPYVIAGDLTLADKQLTSVNNRENDLAEYGKVMKATPQVINIGNDPASNVKVNVSTDDEYIMLIGDEGPCEVFSITIPAIPAHGSSSEVPPFYFKVDDVVPANHNSFIKMEIIFNGDTVIQSKKVKLYAPDLKITALTIDDTQEGNGNHRVDFNETVTCQITIKNSGNMPIVGGNLYLENPGEELLLQTDSIYFSAIEEGGSVVVSFQATASSAIEEPVTTFVRAGYWVNYYHEYVVFPITIGAVMEDWETGDFTNLAWQNNSSIPWTITTQNPYEGTYCAKSGNIGRNSSTQLNITYTFSVSDTLSFYYKVSSEQQYDKLFFKIDGQTKEEWSGEISWTRAAYLVPAGMHTFTWTYQKDSGVDFGEDCCYIDAISFSGIRVNHPVGVEENSPADITFRIWPNPATDELHIQVYDEEEQNYTYQLFDLTGKLLQGGRLSDNHADIDVRNCVSGVYILKMENGQHQVQTAKIIKK